MAHWCFRARLLDSLSSSSTSSCSPLPETRYPPSPFLPLSFLHHYLISSLSGSLQPPPRLQSAFYTHLGSTQHPGAWSTICICLGEFFFFCQKCPTVSNCFSDSNSYFQLQPLHPLPSTLTFSYSKLTVLQVPQCFHDPMTWFRWLFCAQVFSCKDHTFNRSPQTPRWNY